MIKANCKRMECGKEFEYDPEKVRLGQGYCSNKCAKIANAENMRAIYQKRVKDKKKRRSSFSFTGKY